MNLLAKIKGLFGKKTKPENSNTVSSSNINKILEEYRVLDVLKEAGVERGFVSKLYDRELARKARLTKLLKEGDEI